jgi:cysteine desulfurase
MTTDQLVFTSGGTESDNLAVFGLASLGKQRLLDAGTINPGQKPVVLLSAIEHPAVLLCQPKLESMGFEVRLIPVDFDGVVKLDALSDLLQDPVAPVVFVSVMLANNETGVLQPVKAIADLCVEKNILVHTDAVQAVGKIPVSFAGLNVDALTFTAHKFAGPRGIGGLLLRHGISPEPMQFGGFQQTAIRPGTEDVSLVCGLARAMEKFVVDVGPHRLQLANARDELQNGLTGLFPDLVINGGNVDRTPQTINLSLPGLNRQSILMAADLAGLAISTGSACASGSSDPSPVLLAMGLDSEIVDSAVRISVGYTNSTDQVKEAVVRFQKIFNRLSSG